MELHNENKSLTENQGKKNGKRLFTVEETAYYLGLAPRTIYNAVAPKSKNPFPVKPKRIGKLVRFDLRDLDKYVDSLDSQSSAS